MRVSIADLRRAARSLVIMDLCDDCAADTCRIHRRLTRVPHCRHCHMQLPTAAEAYEHSGGLTSDGTRTPDCRTPAQLEADRSRSEALAERRAEIDAGIG